MVLAEPKTIHNLKDLENKFVTPSGEPDKGAYRQETENTKGCSMYEDRIDGK